MQTLSLLLSHKIVDRIRCLLTNTLTIFLNNFWILTYQLITYVIL